MLRTPSGDGPENNARATAKDNAEAGGRQAPVALGNTPHGGPRRSFRNPPPDSIRRQIAHRPSQTRKKTTESKLGRVVSSGIPKAVYGDIQGDPNFLKHADKDHDAELHVGNIVGFNVMMLAVSTANYFRLFDEFTDHMRAFQSLAKLTYPSSFVTEEQRPAFDASLPAFEHMTPADFFDAMLRGEYAIVLPNIQAEKVQDLVDNQPFYATPFAVHRQGP
jgi:hypothetical protein